MNDKLASNLNDKLASNLNDKLASNLTGKLNDNLKSFVLVAGALALAAVLEIFLMGKMSGTAATSRPAPQAAAGPDNRAIVALPALAIQSSGRTSGLAKVYAAPNDRSSIASVLAPSQTVTLLGRKM